MILTRISEAHHHLLKWQDDKYTPGRQDCGECLQFQVVEKLNKLTDFDTTDKMLEIKL